MKERETWLYLALRTAYVLAHTFIRFVYKIILCRYANFTISYLLHSQHIHAKNLNPKPGRIEFADGFLFCLYGLFLLAFLSHVAYAFRKHAPTPQI